MSELSNQAIFDEARRYLLSLPGVTESVLQRQLAFPEADRPTTKNELFKRMIDCATDRRGMPNAIGDTARLAPFLADFDPHAVVANYRRWEDVFDAIKQGYKPPGRMVKSNPHNYWVTFCKSILSVAKYVSRFTSIEDFNLYVDQFVTDHADIRLGLPLILKEEIFGYQFTLACNFVKENISPEFVKPDVHIKAIFEGIGKSPRDASDFQVFRDVVSFAKSIGQTPYAVDKLFWLVGSGNFYLSNVKARPDREAFIDRINRLRRDARREDAGKHD